MNEKEFINKADKVFDKVNSMKEPKSIAVVIGNGSEIFTDEYFSDGEYLYLLMDDTFIAKLKYEDVKDIKISDDELFDNEEVIKNDREKY